VEERWVCRRCFAANGASDDSCAQCGLSRDAVPTPQEQAAALQSAAAVEAGRQPGWQRLLRFWWIPAIGIFLAFGYFGFAHRDANGAISGGGTLSIQDLAVGDCFDVAESDEVSQVDAAPCAEPHAYELFHIATWREGEAFPSDSAMESFVIAECGSAYAAYVGERVNDVTLDVIFFTPTADGWGSGDRVFQCAVYDTTNAELSGSLRSS
jgi:hypothetical protein